MIEQRTPVDFERRLGELVMAYTDAATMRSSDPAQVARTARAAGAGRRATWPLRAGVLGRWLGSPQSAVGLVAVVLIGVVAVAIGGRRSEPVVTRPSDSRASSPGDSPSSDASILEILGRGWQRPSPVAPGPDLWGSGSLTLTDGLLAFGREPGDLRSTVAVNGPGTFVVTATPATPGCQVGDGGTYGWTLEGQDTVLTLTPRSPDACAVRQALLAGPWVRAGLVGPPIGTSLVPGTHHSTAFDPFGDPRRPAQLGYTVPAGWEIVQDDRDTFVLHEAADASAGAVHDRPDDRDLAQPGPDGGGAGRRSVRCGLATGRRRTRGRADPRRARRRDHRTSRGGVIATATREVRRPRRRGARPAACPHVDRRLHHAGRPGRDPPVPPHERIGRSGGRPGPGRARSPDPRRCGERPDARHRAVPPRAVPSSDVRRAVRGRDARRGELRVRAAGSLSSRPDARPPQPFRNGQPAGVGLRWP